MADYDEEEGSAPYQWQSLDVPAEVDENPTEKFVKEAGK